jgi:hypothetical protein
LQRGGGDQHDLHSFQRIAGDDDQRRPCQRRECEAGDAGQAARQQNDQQQEPKAAMAAHARQGDGNGKGGKRDDTQGERREMRAAFASGSRVLARVVGRRRVVAVRLEVRLDLFIEGYLQRRRGAGLRWGKSNCGKG